MSKFNQPWLPREDTRLIQFIDNKTDWHPKVAKQHWQEIATALKRTPIATKARAAVLEKKIGRQLYQRYPRGRYKPRPSSSDDDDDESSLTTLITEDDIVTEETRSSEDTVVTSIMVSTALEALDSTSGRPVQERIQVLEVFRDQLSQELVACEAFIHLLKSQ
jgi:hypothetical protein